MDKGSSRLVYASQTKPIVYKIAKDAHGILQNSNERRFATSYPDIAPIVHHAHTVRENPDAILTVERVIPLKDVLYDAVRDLQLFATRHSFYSSEITYADCKQLVPHILTPRSVKNALNELFDSEDNTLVVEQDLDSLVADVCERMEPILEVYFSESIDKQTFCTEECVVDNIGLRLDACGHYSFVILDSGIPNITVFTHVLDLDIYTPY